ncbi:SCP-like extracellular protein [Phytophthora cinnamomi]|uniref:SCP-like extracellular protein n=1 Tax=Phytophthora cinnamomi TaxID=4785 RepID=UPI003559C42E|nr:SCP-like extracellular protein [Phytophthora cinnamomi]
MQKFARFLKPAAVLALAAGLLDTSVAQDAASQLVALSGTVTSNAQVTASLATSVSQEIVKFGDSLSGQVAQTLQQILSLADANAEANNQLNAALQSLLNTAQSFTSTDDNAASTFTGRKLRTEHDK